MGDCGGLLRGLNAVFKIFINPYSVYMLESKLAWLLFRLVPSSKEKNLNIAEQITHENLKDERIEPMGFIKQFCLKYRVPKHHKLLRKAKE